MPPPPNTFQISLSRSDNAVRIRTYWGAPIQLEINSYYSLTGVTQLIVQVFNKRQGADPQLMAQTTVANPTGNSAVADLTAGQMRLPLLGQRSASFILVIRAILEDGSTDVYELGTLEALSVPETDDEPPEPPPDTEWADTGYVSDSLTSLSGSAMLDQDSRLKEIVSGSGYELTSITRDADDVITTATVLWPDGSGGTFTTLDKNSSFNSIDSFSITYVPAEGDTKTITQPLLTRNANGAVTTKPALTVA